MDNIFNVENIIFLKNKVDIIIESKAHHARWSYIRTVINKCRVKFHLQFKGLNTTSLQIYSKIAEIQDAYYLHYYIINQSYAVKFFFQI